MKSNTDKMTEKKITYEDVEKMSDEERSELIERLR